MRVLPALTEIFGAIAVCASAAAHQPSLDALAARGAHVLRRPAVPANGGPRIGIARRTALELALQADLPFILAVVLIIIPPTFWLAARHPAPLASRADPTDTTIVNWTDPDSLRGAAEGLPSELHYWHASEYLRINSPEYLAAFNDNAISIDIKGVFAPANPAVDSLALDCLQLTDVIAQNAAALHEARRLRAKVQSAREHAAGRAEVINALDAFNRQVQSVAGLSEGSTTFTGLEQTSPELVTLQAAGRKLSELATAVNSADTAPTETAIAAWNQAQRASAATMSQWNALKRTALAQLNQVLRQYGLAEIQP